jgi:hypothetical protein
VVADVAQRNGLEGLSLAVLHRFSSSGSRATLAAIRRASSRVSRFMVWRRLGPLDHHQGSLYPFLLVASKVRKKAAIPMKSARVLL